jgi:hypothetical protein
MNIIKNPTLTKAKKEHKCDFCGGLIREGENYMNSTYVYDGIYDWKNHLNCDYIANKLDMYNQSSDWGDEGLTGDMFQEIIREEYYTLISDKIKPFINSVSKDIWGTILNEIRKVNFYSQLDFVVRNYRKIDKNTL